MCVSDRRYSRGVVVVQSTGVARRSTADIDVCAASRRSRRVRPVGRRPAAGPSRPVAVRPGRHHLVVQLVYAPQQISQLTHPQTAGDAATATRRGADEQWRYGAVVPLEHPRRRDAVVDGFDV